jgi:hypoxanthine phosphoribosyltransferase
MPEIVNEHRKRLTSVDRNPRLGEVLITQQRIADRVRELADQIRDRYDHNPNSELVIVSIMTGALVFLADLIRRLPLPMRIALMMVSNYPGQSTRAQGVQIQYDTQEDLTGKDVLIVDDILETGQTLSAVVELVKNRGARSVSVCVLLEKVLQTPRVIDADFVGFQIPDKFVVGYGLDYDNLFRNYPEIAVLEV